MINILPEFESRQVLTSDELNWMACYLDTQNRQSRKFLIGCGLIGGLQVKLVDNSVQVTNGIGITSAGHLVHLSNSMHTLTTYTKSKKYTQQVNEKLAFHYLPDADLNAENYAKSVEAEALYTSLFKGEVVELFEESFNDATPIDGIAMKGKVALLFAEIIQRELKDCEGENCQERGKKYIFTTKVLAISKEDALLLLDAEYRTNTQNENALHQLAFPWMHLQNINILKPVFSNSSVNVAFEEKIIVQEYQRCIIDFITGFEKVRAQFEQSLRNLSNYYIDAPGDVAFVQAFINTYKSINLLTDQKLSASTAVIAYDYLWCFTKAYQELQVEAQHLRAKTFTRERAFPNHLLLGIIDNQNMDFDAPVSTSHAVYRHSFQSKFVQTQQADVAKKITVHLRRLAALAVGFDKAVLESKKEIKITAGGSLYGPLSGQAVPWYLNETAASVWNTWSTHLHLAKYITYYGTLQENQTATNETPYNRLPTAFQGDHSFFRVEGVYRQTALVALNTVFQLRKKHGLAFEVLMLRLNEKAPFSHAFNYTINEDVESMYQVVRSEILNQISFNINYLAALQLKLNEFEDLKTSITTALEESYLLFLNKVNVSLLARPLTMQLTQAITASNITNNYKAAAVTDEAEFNELEMAVAQSKAASSSLVKRANIGIAAQIREWNIVRPVRIVKVFFNTMGHLVDSIKKSDKFKSTSDISFYTHLLTVAKEMRDDNRDELLFEYVLRLYCALKLHDEYLPENFLELDVTKYKDNLEDDLLPAAVALADYLKKAISSNDDDEKFRFLKKNDLLDYVERIRFDDDWIKIIQLDAENKKRNGGLGVENLLERFVKLHPGLAHGCGVPIGGTYIMVYDTTSTVIVDFYLPYLISSNLRPIQYTLVENKTLTLSGTINDSSGKPVATTLLIGTATIRSDDTGFYNASVSENSTVKVICTVAGFQKFERDVVIRDKPETLNIFLQPVEVSQKTTTIKFINQSGDKISRNINLKNLSENKSVVAENGILRITDIPNKEFKFETEDDRIEKKQFAIITSDSDKEDQVPLIELAIIRVQLVSEQGYKPGLLDDIKIIDPPMELNTADVRNGLFTTSKGLDITKSALIKVVYNQELIEQVVKPGEKVNNVTVKDSGDERKERKLKAVVGIVYKDVRPDDRLSAFVINSVAIPINLQRNVGEEVILTKGELDFNEFPNVAGIDIDNFSDIKSIVCLLDRQMIKEKEKLSRDSFFTFTAALTPNQIKILRTEIREFREIERAVELRVENFYCMLLPEEILMRIKRSLEDER